MGGDKTNYQNQKINDLLTLISKKIDPSPELADIRQFVLGDMERSAWHSKLKTKDKGLIYFRLLAVNSGYSVLEFSDIKLRDPIAQINSTQST